MKGLLALIKKDWLEAIRSYRLLILLIVFAGLGCLNPISARYLPELVSSFLPEGFPMDLPSPVVMDSWLQFFKNTVQIGLVAMVMTAAPSMANEIGKGVLIPLLAKGLPRRNVILAKAISLSMVWTLSFACAFLVTFLYNFMFWETSLVPHLFPIIFGIWLFGEMIIMALLLGGVMQTTTSASLLWAGMLLLLCMAASLFPVLSEWTPIVFLSQYQTFLTEGITFEQFFKPLLCESVLLLLQLFAAIVLFQKKSL